MMRSADNNDTAAFTDWWIVTGTVLSVGPAIIMTGPRARSAGIFAFFVSSARNSVWPGNLNPCCIRDDFCIGFVTTPDAFPARVRETAFSMLSITADAF
jgi:hypothetical protein